MPSAVMDKKQGTYVIPAQHTNRLREFVNGDQEPPVALHRIVQQVFSADYNYVYDIPASKIHKFANSDKATRLVLCANYDAADPTGSCALGERCKFVHADVREVCTKTVHTNYAWNCVAEVTYERFTPGKVFRVAAPSSKTITDILESHTVLKTKALSSQRRPLSHCAHYYFNRTCNLGSDCQFIHAVYVDPDAKPHQRAPAPTQLGRPMRVVGHAQQIDGNDNVGMDEVDEAFVDDVSLMPTPTKSSGAPTPLAVVKKVVTPMLQLPIPAMDRPMRASVSFMTPTITEPTIAIISTDVSSDSEAYPIPTAPASATKSTTDSPVSAGAKEGSLKTDALAAAMLGRATPILSPAMLTPSMLTPRTPEASAMPSPAMQSPATSRNNSMVRGLSSWQSETHLAVTPEAYMTLSPASAHMAQQLNGSVGSAYDGNNNSRGTPYRHNPYVSRLTPNGGMMPPSPLQQSA